MASRESWVVLGVATSIVAAAAAATVSWEVAELTRKAGLTVKVLLI
jgi:hypothetical protein